jgi:hypothetical protein
MATDRKVKPSNLDVQIWAKTGITQFPTQPKYDAGWSFEVPIDEEENYIQNQQDRAIANINQQGVPDWDASTTYWINSWVTYDDGVDVLKYISLQDTNEGNTPDPVGNAWWVRLDVFESTAQTFADSRLENVNVSVSSKVASISLDNVDDLGGNDPALETLAAKIANDSGGVKNDQILKTDSSGDLLVNKANVAQLNNAGRSLFAPSGSSNLDGNAGLALGSATNGLILRGDGSVQDITLRNDGNVTVAAIPTGTTNFKHTGYSVWGAANQVDPEASTGQIRGSSIHGLVVNGSGSTNDFLVLNKHSDLVVYVPSGSNDLRHTGFADFLDGGSFVAPTGSVHGRISGDDVNGLMLGGNGSTQDLTVRNNANSTIVSVPTGTTNLQHNFRSTFLNSNDTSNPSGSEKGQVYGSSTNGLILQGDGSSNDLLIKNGDGDGVSTVASGTRFLKADITVPDSDNSQKYATTSFVNILLAQFFTSTSEQSAVDGSGTKFERTIDMGGFKVKFGRTTNLVGEGVTNQLNYINSFTNGTYWVMVGSFTNLAPNINNNTYGRWNNNGGSTAPTKDHFFYEIGRESGTQGSINWIAIGD